MSAEQLHGFTYQFHPTASPAAPVLLLLHGTGADEGQLLDVGRTLAADAALLAPRGRVVEGDGMPRFFRRIPTGDSSAYPFRFDSDEVLQRAGELADFVAGAAERHELSGRPIISVGFSNGANMGAVLLLAGLAQLRAGILLAPMSVLEDPPRRDLSSAGALLAGGRRDPIATPAHVEALAGVLADRGASVALHWHDGGHELPVSAVEAGRSWLDRLRQAIAVDPLP